MQSDISPENTPGQPEIRPARIVGLRFRDNGQVYFFSAGSHEVRPGDYVLVKSDQGTCMAKVELVRDEIPPELNPADIKPILRPATPEDVTRHAENTDMGRQALRYCRQCISERGLDMKLVDVEIYHDRSKLVFYFTAPNRIDFRDLVKDLVKNYRTRIELRQIGVRHETQMIGAVGNCGQMCCCARFIRKFQPVTIKMAKEQNLFLNPTKISGMCGRLLCCLAYEQSTYEDFQRKCPKFGKKYQTSQGPVKILRSNIFRETISVISEEGEEKELTLEDWGRIAGERWVQHVPAPLAPAQSQTQAREEAPAQAPQAPEHPAGPAKEAQAQGESPEPGKAKSKRRRKRKAKPRRHPGQAAAGQESSGE